MTAQLIEKWFRSENALCQYLSNIGLAGLEGRVYRDFQVLPAKNHYGRYSQRNWFLHLIEDNHE